MNKAIKICLIAFAILYFVCFILFIAGGIIPLALSKDIIAEMMKTDPKLTQEAAEVAIATLAATMFMCAFIVLAAAVVCVVSLPLTKKNLSFGKRITLSAFNLAIGSTPAGVLLLIQTIKMRKHHEI